jgi:hypothetical protein
MRRTSIPETRKVAALKTYATSGLEAATRAPPAREPTIQVRLSADWRSPLACGRSRPLTRFGRAAYWAGRKKLVATPAARARSTIWSAPVAKGSVKKTAARARSAPTRIDRRWIRSISGPAARPMTTSGRNSAIRRALTQLASCVRS